MTEEQAKTKWCPMVRVYTGMGASFNKNSCGTRAFIEASTNCIASDCMMWVWIRDYKYGMDFKTDKGYCGIAGDSQ